MGGTRPSPRVRGRNPHGAARTAGKFVRPSHAKYANKYQQGAADEWKRRSPESAAKFRAQHEDAQHIGATSSTSKTDISGLKAWRLPEENVYCFQAGSQQNFDYTFDRVKHRLGIGVPYDEYPIVWDFTSKASNFQKLETSKDTSFKKPKHCVLF